ncbi:MULTISPECIES: imelysin family protein [Halomonadaceae]|jgi:putative iron-regulated protein|uniref:imelysin family protein n=1 Tax=Halomonadaceae TaxID=28256 RepID=UPI00034A36D3|nr:MULTISPECIES: imelysin family protein [Halomonas]UEQ05161.1 peptidase [Halomonas profundus]MCE7516988.1 peptidase [Halomonas titanicae]NVE90349.1 peptidase [Halomonas titanicae]TMU27197.1 peptidase [Halomonas sp. ATBC28]CAD5274726.1 Iron-regulated protein [Halomonas sp. 156]
MPAIMLRRPLAGIVALSALMPFAPVAVDTAAADTVSADAVVKHYADLAHANYADALNAAQALNERIDELLANPTAETLSAAKQAWLQARVPYQQSEVFRFGNAVVDDWEGQLNAWPLDEGMIDYVEGDDYQHELGNEGATANIIANEQITVGGETLDVSDITPALLADLNEIGGSEANVASGYHAIEFLLWGQDLHGFEEGNGERPVSDYQTGDDCTHGHCDRRRSYLDAVSDLLVDDLEWMVAQWAPETEGNYRQELLAESDQEGLRRMLFGMGSLSLGELAGERMKVALEANSFEDEHDCFSDNTHNSHYYNGQGVQNIYTGSYQRLDGSVVEGPSLQDLLSQADSELADTLGAQLEATMARLDAIKQAAEAESSPMAFDMMIAPGNEQGSELINEAILSLVAQTGSIEQAAGELGVTSLQPDDAGHRF